MYLICSTDGIWWNKLVDRQSTNKLKFELEMSSLISCFLSLSLYILLIIYFYIIFAQFDHLLTSECEVIE